jgi:hypothetical protein
MRCQPGTEYPLDIRPDHDKRVLRVVSLLLNPEQELTGSVNQVGTNCTRDFDSTQTASDNQRDHRTVAKVGK